MCAEEPLFSLTPMSLPVPAPFFTTEHCFLPQPAGLRRSPSTIGNGARLHSIPQECPGGTADNLEARSCAWTRSNTHVLWKWFKSSRNIWRVRFKLSYTQMDMRVVQFGSMNVQNWSLWEFEPVWDRLENQASLCQSPLSFQGLMCPMFFNDELSCVLVSTLLQNAARTAGALMLLCWLETQLLLIIF